MEQQDCHRFKGGDGQLLLAGVSETANIADRVLRLMSVVQARVPGSCDRAERPAAERRSAGQRGRKVDGDHGQQRDLCGSHCGRPRHHPAEYGGEPSFHRRRLRHAVGDEGTAFSVWSGAYPGFSTFWELSTISPPPPIAAC